MKKTFLTIALAVMISVGAVSAVSMTVDELIEYQGKQQVIATQEVEPQEEMLGGTYAPMIVGLRTVTKAINNEGTVYATTTLQAKESGTNYFLSGTGTTIILPAVAASKGVNFKFTIKGASGIGNWIIDSAEGDNIEGTLIVAGAVVDCNAVDQINFVVDGENIGDYVEVYSDGTQWLIGDSGVLTGSKMTCSDPS